MITARPPTRRPVLITKRPPTPRPLIITKRPPTTRKPIPTNQFVLPEVKVNVNRPIVYAGQTTTSTTTTASTTLLNTRTTPPPNVFVDGFIIGNINRNPEDKDLPRNENQNVRLKPDFSNLNWMDPEKQEALALIESDMVDQHNIDGVRPMFEFTFEDDATEVLGQDHDHHPEDQEGHDHSHEHSDDHDHHDHQEDHGEHHGDHSHEHDHEEHHGDHEHDHGDHHHGHGDHHMEGDHAIHEMHHEHHDHASHHDHHDHHGHMDHGHHDQGHTSSNGFHLPKLPEDHQGLEETTNKLKRAEKSFITINNDLGFTMFKQSIEDPEHIKENLIFSPLSATTSLALVFLGARGVTSWQINELLRLDEMISFNPHLMYKSITDDLGTSSEDSFTTACVKELLIDEDESPLIEFYRARVDYFYSGTIEQIDFDQLNVNAGRLIDDMVARKTKDKIMDFMAQDTIPAYAPPMISLGANVFHAEFPVDFKVNYEVMNFINLPSRGRRLVKVPSIKLSGKFYIGYEESLQATTAAIPFQKDKFCLVLILPGKPSDYIAGGLSQIESKLNNETWTALMRSMQVIDHVELQFPVINHRYGF